MSDNSENAKQTRGNVVGQGNNSIYEVTKSISAKTNNNEEDIHDKILNQSYEEGNSTSMLCDVLNKYRWSIDQFRNSSAIPYCHLIEYKQEHNSIITNLVNSISAAGTSFESNKDNLGVVFNNVKSLANAITSAAIGELTDAQKTKLEGAVNGVSEVVGNVADSQMGQKAKSAVEDGIEKVASFGEGVMSVLNAAWSSISDRTEITNGITGSKYLKPYSLLYWLSATDKRYTFPMISELPKHKLNNAFGDNNGDSSIFSANSLISSISNFASEVPSAIRDIVELGGGKRNAPFSGAFVEKAKFFQYPQETEEYTIQFPLINTVSSGNSSYPEWKKNYKFIMLFTVRNMIFRKNNSEYYPPLFYDLNIPGVIRQPFCYVSNVDVQPFGMVRMKKYDGNIFGIESGGFDVPVPEMWIVTIKLKSLVPTSANMILSGLYDLNIEIGKKQ